jgi:hypothetical protein
VSVLGFLVAGLASAAQPQQSAVEAAPLDWRIAAPVREEYEAILDAREWLNPKLLIRAEGVDIESYAIPASRKTVSTREIQAFLVGLPLDAWPYGRVVLASDPGLRRADASGRLDENEERSIRRNHDATERILRLLDIEINWWPP